MLIGEIIQRVQSLYSKGISSDDVRLSSRHIYSKLVSTRAKILYQKRAKRQKISSWSYQTISCAEVIDVKVTECPCIPVSGCMVKRIKYALPKPITGIIESNIEHIMSLDGTIKFDESSRTEMLHVSGNKYTSKKYRFVIDKGFAYLYGTNVPKVVQIRMLCEDPVEAATFPDTCGNCPTCVDPFDVEFPIETGYVDTLIEEAVKELFSEFAPKEDTKNDSADSK